MAPFYLPPANPRSGALFFAGHRPGRRFFEPILRRKLEFPALVQH